MPNWLKKRMEEEVVVTNDQLKSEQNTATDKPAPVNSNTSLKKDDKDVPWWLRPKEGDEGIKKVFQRAALIDTDLEIEEKPNDSSFMKENDEKSNDRRRRFDDLLEMQVTSSSDHEIEADELAQEKSSDTGRRIGVVESWHSRSRKQNAEETSNSYGSYPLEESGAKQNIEVPNDGMDRIESAKSQASHTAAQPPSTENCFDEGENVFSVHINEWTNTNQDSSNVFTQQFEEELNENNTNAVPKIAHQPWRDFDFENAERFSNMNGSPAKSAEETIRSPGSSPVRQPNSGRKPSYQQPLVSSSWSIQTFQLIFLISCFYE